jgi:hypothetical protein
MHSLFLFLAPETTPAQATMTSPPAVAGPVRTSPGRSGPWLRRIAGIAGDMLGFTVLFAGCWLFLVLLATLLRTA